MLQFYTPSARSEDELNIASRSSLWPPMGLAVGYLPLLILQARSLSDRPHLSGYPLALLGGLALTVLATRNLGVLVPGTRLVTSVAVGTSGALLVIAAITAWPWLGTVAAMETLLAAAYGLGGLRLVRAILPGWVFVALAILPPNYTEGPLVHRLQTLVTGWSSALLHWLGVVHATEGIVIRISGHRLMVEQACSGVRSLMFVLGCTLFFVLWSHRTLVRSASLLAAAVCWVLLGNILRVTIVSYLMSRWNLDVSTGVRHEALGLSILAAVLGLIYGTDRLWDVVATLTSRVIARPWRSRSRVGHASEKSVGATAVPDLEATWLGSWLLGTVFAVLGVVQSFSLAPQLAAAFRSDRIVTRLQGLKAHDLPDHWSGLPRTEFQIVERDFASDLGRASRFWRYQHGNRTATVSVDYPFRGWHELTVCYRNLGWDLRERVVRTNGFGPYVEATFVRPNKRPAVLLFGLDDQTGTPQDPNSARNYLGLSRLTLFTAPPQEIVRRLATHYESAPRGYQVQVLLEADTPISATYLVQAQRLFLDARSRVRSTVTGSPRTDRPELSE